MQPKLGIIAGGGAIPGYLIDHCRDEGRPYFVVALEGHSDELQLDQIPHIRARLGGVGPILAALHEQSVEQLVLIGSLKRPSLKELRLDARGARILMKAGKAAFGDDGLLSAVVGELEAEGFSVVGIDDILADLIVAAGALGSIAPDQQALQDIQRGQEVIAQLGNLDIGQAAVVQDGYVLAVEAAEGTDEMLARCGALKREGLGGILVKCRKPGQDRRVDLPTIASRTVERAAAAGLRGVAVEANASLLVDGNAAVNAANRLGFFIFGMEMEDDNG